MRVLLVGILTILTVQCYAQTGNDSTGTVLFNRGLEYYNNEKLDSAILVWTEIVEKKIAKNFDTYGVAFFNIPTTYWKMNNTDKAKEWYKRVIESDLNDFDETGSIMEPHTNYKYKSAVALAGLYQLDSLYAEELHWLNMADTVYRYWGFEGSATNVSIEEASILESKVDVLLKLDKKDEAIQQIITELIYAGNLEDFFKDLEEKLLTLIDKKTFKSEFDEALKGLIVENIDSDRFNALFTLRGLQYRISISKNQPENLPHYWKTLYLDKKTVVDKEYLLKYIKARHFYTRLKK